MNNHIPHQTDVLIIGAGAAGLSIAIRLAQHLHVTLALKDDFPGGASYWAQGGIAVALQAEDSPSAHTQDTLKVGAGLCHLDTVQFVTEHAKSQLDWLLAQGVPFTEEYNGAGDLHLTREGGHSFRRIVHHNDATGAAIQTRLAEVARQLPNLTILPNRIAIDISLAKNSKQHAVSPTVCNGAYLYNKTQQTIEVWHSHAVVLATGGASRAWLHSTNPEMASGDGIAIAWRAGCRVANLEFNQFHPTCLYTPPASTPSRSFLLTEALRGEGAHLVLPDGSRFMPTYHPDAELAPRDIVARAIDTEIKKHQLDCVYLDISHKPSEWIRTRFPTVYGYCLQQGIDITSSRAPVVPAAHYTCGGVITDLHGVTDIPQLYAIGEVACTGLHGANRIASNSLLECFVFSDAAAQHILAKQHLPQLENDHSSFEIQEYSAAQADNPHVHTQIASMLHRLRQTMSQKVGIVRNLPMLEEAHSIIAELKQTLHTSYPDWGISQASLELRNLVHVSELIVRSALARKESRGLHYMTDYPNPDPTLIQDTILSPADAKV
jgi:L-aspartate oxidase